MRSLSEKEEELLKKYKQRLEQEFSPKQKRSTAAPQLQSSPHTSSSYQAFKQENLPRHLSLYEKLCKASYRLLKVSPGRKSEEQLQKNIELCHLDIPPAAPFSLSIIAFAAMLLFFILMGAVAGSLFIIVYGLIIGLLVLTALLKLPEFLANNWRLKASNEMVQCIFYVVTYMRHTSNLELAVRFASDHLTPPLSIDLKKVLWDVETTRYGTVQESLDRYLETWKEYNPEFMESFHLVEGSLYEPSEDKRLNMVDKALSVMLEETYEKMLRYTHDLKNPITMLYMLGIILPVLGLVILPLIASFMTSDVAPLTLALYIALLYNVTLPILIYYLSKMTLSKRPTGYGESDISDQFHELKKYGKICIRLPGKEIRIHPGWLAVIVTGTLLFIGLIPLLLGATLPTEILLNERVFDDSLQFKFLEYRKASSTGELIGPYGLGASVLSMLIPLAFGLGMGLYYHLSSKNIIKIREETRKLEEEFASALFQLGNRLGDGLPLELAFGKVAEVTKGTKTGQFFETAYNNIIQRGMDVETALFDQRFGATHQFPSAVIQSSMKVLLESSKKGPKIAAQTMINVSEYIKDIHRVDERLKDLMAEIISDMKQQTRVLAPAIAGIVVGITSMIVVILGRLTDQLGTITESAAGGAANVPTGLITLFGDGIPTYYFQTIVGLYIVQIIYLMTVLVNGIENGSDKLAEQYQLGENLIKSTLIYVVIALVVVVLFNTIAVTIMQSLLTG